jgi:hypothetical protein
MAQLTGRPGFATRRAEHARSQRSAVALIATVALTVSLVVAATAVSMGNKSFARGDIAARLSAPLPRQ